MNRALFLIFAIITITAAVSLYIGNRQDIPSTPITTRTVAQHKTALGVEQLMRSVDRYKGTILLEGVVSAVSPKQLVFALIDLKEFQRCGITSCASLTLPVRWMGSMPLAEETVRVEGEMQESGGKLVFVARSLEKVELQLEGSL